MDVQRGADMLLGACSHIYCTCNGSEKSRGLNVHLQDLYPISKYPDSGITTGLELKTDCTSLVLNEVFLYGVVSVFLKMHG